MALYKYPIPLSQSPGPHHIYPPDVFSGIYARRRIQYFGRFTVCRLSPQPSNKYNFKVMKFNPDRSQT
jgi:hypothetical protein